MKGKSLIVPVVSAVATVAAFGSVIYFLLHSATGTGSTKAAAPLVSDQTTTVPVMRSTDSNGGSSVSSVTANKTTATTVPAATRSTRTS